MTNEYGRGVPQDHVEAHKWYGLAASRSAPGKEQDMIAEDRDAIAAKTTPEQLAEAQKRAREWKPSH